MKKSLIRIALLALLFTAGFIGTLSIPADNSQSWFADLILSKAAGAAGFLLFARLYGRWKKTDPWVREYDRRNRTQC